MRSGGLDFYGLAGQPILYVATEQLSNENRLVGDERMKGVTTALAGKPDMQFDRFIASRQPKRWTTEGDVVKRDETRKTNETSGGFLKNDLDALIAQIKQRLRMPELLLDS